MEGHAAKCGRLPVESDDGGGFKNRRLSSFPFRFLTDDAKEATGVPEVCPEACVHETRDHNAARHSYCWQLVGTDGGGLNDRSARRASDGRFRVSTRVAYTWKSTVKVAERLRRRFAKPVSRRSAFLESRLNSRVLAESVPIPILSRRVRPAVCRHDHCTICCTPVAVEHGYRGTQRPRRARLGDYSRA